MIGVRMIEAAQSAADLVRPRLREPVVRRADAKAPPRSGRRRVGKPERLEDAAIFLDQRPATFVGIGLGAVLPNARFARFY